MTELSRTEKIMMAWTNLNRIYKIRTSLENLKTRLKTTKTRDIRSANRAEIESLTNERVRLIGESCVLLDIETTGDSQSDFRKFSAIVKAYVNEKNEAEYARDRRRNR